MRKAPTKLEIKKLSKIIKSFTKGKSAEYLLLETMDNLSEYILQNWDKERKTCSKN